jgi:hypothetical protein
MKRQIKEIKNEFNKQFNEAFYALPDELTSVIQDELYNTLYWSQRTLYYRLDGTWDIKKIEIPLIEQVFHKYGIQVFKQTAIN